MSLVKLFVNNVIFYSVTAFVLHNYSPAGTRRIKPLIGIRESHSQKGHLSRRYPTIKASSVLEEVRTSCKSTDRLAGPSAYHSSDCDEEDAVHFHSSFVCRELKHIKLMKSNTLRNGGKMDYELTAPWSAEICPTVFGSNFRKH